MLEQEAAEGWVRVRSRTRRYAGLSAVFPGQDTASQREIRDNAYALIKTKRNKFVLGCSIGKRVAGLRGNIPRVSSHFADAEGLHQLPGGVVGGANVAHFAGRNHVIQRAQCFIQRGMRVKGMDLVQIDIIRLQTPQAVFQLLRRWRREEPRP